MSAPTEEAGLSLAEQAYHAICDRLVMLRINPGAPINDERLARELGLGRTPVREALKRLELERLVVAFPRRGTFATEVHISDLRHISEVRAALEPLAAADAAQRAGAADALIFERLLEELPAAARTDHRDLIRLDTRVHRAVYAAAYNPYLTATLLQYGNLATRIWCLFVDRLPGLAGHVAEHEALLRAVLNGDGDTAAELSARHVADFEAAVRAVI
ncbi:FCD domain-containing protein [Streptomyces tsukubensis]|uniref:GntR family transcriptional regulator n=2 Tax=Streptomyces tsukubensis TaxID=83656 RepID=A0A1V4A1D0_9ACTN|nr:GntR family transcriptional regulator [Streptomyces tsukubensis]OON72735.1 GntR family transcriptional regulator [Streptomyces tsukubensis]QFR96831.1 FCD domain-containing protein [Streptomyces tsukubensis]